MTMSASLINVALANDDDIISAEKVKALNKNKSGSNFLIIINSLILN
jgi:hypothetical protein